MVSAKADLLVLRPMEEKTKLSRRKKNGSSNYETTT
jgi:hypothetical protein